MIITKIERQKKKDRFNVHLDGEYAFAVDADTLLNFRGLRVGNPLSDEEASAIKSESEKRAAYARGFAYLSRGMHTLKETRDKLKKLSYTECAITYALDRLNALGLVDDEAYARAYAETHDGRGRIRLKHELSAKGVAKEVIDAVLDESLTEDEEITIATELARKFFASSGDRTKVMRRLLNRGYSYSVIESALLRAKLEDEDEF